MSSQEIPSIAKMMFYGDINEEQVFPFPKFNQEQKEICKEILALLAKFAEEEIDSDKIESEQMLPDELLQAIGEMGLMGLAVPEQYGGLELDYSTYARVFQDMAGYDASVTTMVGAHQSIGFKALQEYGNEKQKEYWLPKVASGEVVAAFCLTEPGAGSDAYSIKTKAVKGDDGNYTIDGQKLWITNAGKAGLYTVFAKTKMLVKDVEKDRITCFIVDKEMEGLSFGEKESKMGIKASETRAVFLDKVKVPAENIIGAEGDGFKIAMNVLNTGRLSLGAGSVGAMKVMLKHAANHATERKQFNTQIKDFGLIQEMLAKMAANIYAGESIVQLTTGKILEGMKDYSLESAICKVFCSESMWECASLSMQVAGGTGYMTEYPYERLMRDSRINMIFEGTNEILRVYLALSGFKGPSDDLKELGKIADFSKAISDPIKSLGIATDFARKRLGKMIVTKTITRAHGDLSEISGNFSSMLNDFSIKVENVLMKLGKKIIQKELPQRRIADMVISLYVVLGVIVRTTSILDDKDIAQDKKDHALAMAKLVYSDRRQDFMKNLKRMGRNLDREIEAVSNRVSEQEGYEFDIIDY